MLILNTAYLDYKEIEHFVFQMLRTVFTMWVSIFLKSIN
jgi:hypothetical protein